MVNFDFILWIFFNAENFGKNPSNYGHIRPKAAEYSVSADTNFSCIGRILIQSNHICVFSISRRNHICTFFHSFRIQYEQSFAKLVPQQIFTYECPSYNALGTELVLNNAHYRRCLLVLFSKTVCHPTPNTI